MGLLTYPIYARHMRLVPVLLCVFWLPGRMQADTEVPVYLEAQSIYFDQVTGLSTYQGQVKVRRGDLTILADKAVVKQKGSDVDTIEGFGAPIVLRKKADLPRQTTVIMGQRLRYDAGSNTVTISDKVITTRGKDVIHSAKLVFHVDENHISAERQADSVPVSAELWPGEIKRGHRDTGTQPNQ
jgi:lipopolysaccharide export system protein LptA